MILPPYPVIYSMQEESESVLIGAQNCSYQQEGALTGDVSPSMLKEIGVSWVLVGHSERRGIFKENDLIIGKKAAAAKEAGVNFILCCGETIEQKRKRRTNYVISKQISAVGFEKLSEVWIAYEPRWAIGTGETATPEVVNQIAFFIKRLIYKKEKGEIPFEKIFVLYGGSVSEENVMDFLVQKNVDGVLIGKSSVRYSDFFAITEEVVKYINKKRLRE